jgi:hypothetical protein
MNIFDALRRCAGPLVTFIRPIGLRRTRRETFFVVDRKAFVSMADW